MNEIRCAHEKTKETNKRKICLDCEMRELTNEEVNLLYNDGKSLDYPFNKKAPKEKK